MDTVKQVISCQAIQGVLFAKNAMTKNVHRQTLSLVIVTATMTALNARSVTLRGFAKKTHLVNNTLLNMPGIHWIMNSKEILSSAVRKGKQFTTGAG